MAENIDNLGLDASDYFAEIDKIVQKNQQHRQSLQNLINKLNETTGAMDKEIIRLRNRDAIGNTLITTLTREEGRWKATSSSINLATQSLRANIRELFRQGDSAETTARRIARANAEQQASFQKIIRPGGGGIPSRAGQITDPEAVTVGADVDIRANQVKNNAIFAQNQQARAKEDAARVADINKATKDYEQLIKNQERLLKRYQEAVRNTERNNTKERERSLVEGRRVLKQYEDAVAANRRRIDALSVGKQLQRQAISPSIATPEEVAKVTSNISKITTAINSGAVSAQRALAIIRSAQSGTAEIFTGAERQVAQAAVNLRKATSGLGETFRKENKTIERSNLDAIRSFKLMATEADTNARRITLTWKDMTRIFLVQSLHTVIGRFIAELRTATLEAQNFQIAISEIRTISLDSQLSFDTWSKSVQNLSNQFGNPIADVAAGAYEAISNQVAKGTETFQFLTTALQFSQVTQANTADSVNLLSSALNSFKFQTTESERLAAVFFKTIDLGRVRASELANTFGRVGPLADALGVTFEEVNAAIATLTINGVPAHETYTLINNILTHLLKPTKAMKELFVQLGVSSGEAAIATFGFAGVLRKIEEATRGSSEEIGVLFQDMRAIRGAVGLTGDALAGFEAVLEKLKKSSRDFDLAKQLIPESAGKQFQIEINKIKNLFITEFGIPFQQLLLDLTKDEEGFNHLADSVRTLTTVLTAAGKAYIAYRLIGLASATVTRLQTIATVAHNEAIALNRYQTVLSNQARAQFIAQNFVAAQGLIGQATAMGRATSASILFRNAMSSVISILSSPVFLTTSAATAAIFIFQRQKQAIDELARFSEEASLKSVEIVQKQTQAFKEQMAERVRFIEVALTAELRKHLETSNQIRRNLQATIDQQEREYREFTKNLESIFDIALKNIGDSVNTLERRLNQATENIKRAQQEIFRIQGDLVKQQFETRLKFLPEAEQIVEITNKIKELRAEANALLSGPNPDAFIAETNLKRATDLFNEAARLNNDLGERSIDLYKEREKIAKRISEIETKSADTDRVAALKDELKQVEDTERESARQVARTNRQIERQELANRKAEIRREIAQAKAESGAVERDQELEQLKNQLTEINKLIAVLPNRQAFEQSILEINKQQTDLLRQYIALQEQERRNVERQHAVETERFEILKDTLKAISSIKIPDTLKTTEDQAKLLAEFDRLLNQATAEGGLADQRALVELNGFRVRLVRDTNEIIRRENIDAASKELAQRKESLEKINQEIISGQVKVDEDRKIRVQNLKNLIAEQLKFLDVQGREFLGFPLRSTDQRTPENLNPAEKAEEALKSIQLLIAELDKTKDPKLLRVIQTRIESINQVFLDLARGKSTTELEVKAKTTFDPGRSIFTILQEFRETTRLLQQTQLDEVAIRESAKQLNSALERLNVDIQGQTDIESLSGVIPQVKKFSNDYITQIRALEQATRDLVTTINNETSRLMGGTPVPGRAMGGLIDFKAATKPIFKPRGTDIIPAMLSPNEFVVNAENTRKFYHELLLINQGIKPKYFAEGGPVTSRPSVNHSSNINHSMNIGDIHVHGVPISGNTTVDAKSLAKAIKREIRLGTVSWNQNNA